MVKSRGRNRFEGRSCFLALSMDIAEIFSPHQLHRKVEKIVCFSYFVNRHDIGVRKNRSRLRLLLKTLGCAFLKNILW